MEQKMNEQINEKISDKIRKLLSVAHCEGAAENERETALRQAYALLAKHNLTVESISEEKNPRTGDVAEGHSMPWARGIAISVASLFFCLHVTMKMRKVNRCGHLFIGKQSNAATAKELAIFIVNSVFKEGDKHRRRLRKENDPNANQYMTNFCNGASIAIARRCKELRMEQERSKEAYPTSTGTSVTLANYYQLEQDSNWKLANDTIKGVEQAKNLSVKYRDNDSFAKGQQFGNNMPLSRSIDDKTEGQKRIG
jgi:hypothetical protein